MVEQYIPPTYKREAYHCPTCGVYSHQTWIQVNRPNSGIIQGLEISICEYCHSKTELNYLGSEGTYSVWYKEKIIYPETISVPPPNLDMDSNIIDDYKEASSIFNKSPRGAAALLRLCVQKLCIQLGEKGENLNDDIKKLVNKGMSTQIQQSLDYVRVIGNNAVHPGVIDFEDNHDIAKTLFQLVNIIAEVMITQPKTIKQLYNSLPQEERDRVQKRDRK